VIRERRGVPLLATVNGTLMGTTALAAPMTFVICRAGMLGESPVVETATKVPPVLSSNGQASRAKKNRLSMSNCPRTAVTTRYPRAARANSQAAATRHLVG